MKIKSEDLKKIKEYEKDKDIFYMLSLIATAEEPLLYSDLESYLIGRSEEGFPTWIWSKEDITPEQVLNLKEDLRHFLVKGESKYTSKKDLYELLTEDYQTSDYFEMGFLSCEKAIDPKKGEGTFTKPEYADKVTLAEYWRDNMKETHKKWISQREAIEAVEGWLEDGNFYVLKNSEGEVVSMAGYSTLENHAKITHVFTPKEERGKGYCQNLVYSLSKKLIEDGYKPVLYTDHHYDSSNHAYKKVGFEDVGYLINYKIFTEK